MKIKDKKSSRLEQAFGRNEYGIIDIPRKITWRYVREDFDGRKIVQFKTNKNPTDNNLFIVNQDRDTVYHKSPDIIKPDTIYTDTLHLGKGLYEMYLSDTAGNGLEFWFMRKQGYGYIRLFDSNGALIHKFQSDCGNGEMLAFSTSPEFTLKSVEPLYDFILFPKIVWPTNIKI